MTTDTMHFHGISAVSETFRNIVDNIRLASRQHKVYTATYAELSRMTDRQLADMRIHRSMIDEIALQQARSTV